jgi:hypothetical protein
VTDPTPTLGDSTKITQSGTTSGFPQRLQQAIDTQIGRTTSPGLGAGGTLGGNNTSSFSPGGKKLGDASTSGTSGTSGSLNKTNPGGGASTGSHRHSSH